MTKNNIFRDETNKIFWVVFFSHSKITFLIIVTICLWKDTRPTIFSPPEAVARLSRTEVWVGLSTSMANRQSAGSHHPAPCPPRSLTAVLRTHPSWFKLPLPRSLGKQYLQISLGHKLLGGRTSRSGFSRAWHFVWCWEIEGTVKNCINECCQPICRSLLRTNTIINTGLFLIPKVIGPALNRSNCKERMKAERQLVYLYLLCVRHWLRYFYLYNISQTSRPCKFLQTPSFGYLLKQHKLMATGPQVKSGPPDSVVTRLCSPWSWEKEKLEVPRGRVP